MKTTLQGNICLCGGVWFSVAMPESEPSFCPFCKKRIDQAHRYSNGDTRQMMKSENSEILPENVKKNVPKAIGDEKLKFVSKICTFCTNEVFFDEKDAHKAETCPYCADKLQDVIKEDSQIFNKLKEAFTGLMGLEELRGEYISVKIKSWNPFKKPLIGEFVTIDHMTLLIKIIEYGTGHIFWIPLSDIKRITEVVIDETD